MVGHSVVMALSLGQAVVGFHGVEVVAGYSVAGEGSVVGGNKRSGCMGASMEPVGIGDIQSPRALAVNKKEEV
jgi:hypothetical protein